MEHPLNGILVGLKELIVISFFLTSLFVLVAGCSPQKEKETHPRKVLILTGQNNHEWEKTTTALLKMYRNLPGYKVYVSDDPEALTYEDIKEYDVLVSNWNNWPDNDLEWDPNQEAAFLKFVEDGGGMVFIHAGASSYYGSNTYHKIGIGRWGKETSHGKPTLGEIYNFDQTHPITKGMNDFYIMDEIWDRTDIYPGVKSLASVSATDEDNGHAVQGNAVFVNEVGEGRCFYTILGHDERALFNTGLQMLLLRATEWAATGNVTIDVPQNLQEHEDALENYSWQETDTTLQLFTGSNLVWQYNYRNRFGKPYFHPIYLNNSRITCENPRDHVWHYGLWFSWKFINNLNYWEYTNDFKSEETGYKSEGTTDIENINIQKNTDHSANIQLEILYHPGNGDPVLRENRRIYVAPQNKDGSYYFDYEHHFLAEFDAVTIDRTPILGEQDGKSWGGYGGLSIRINQDFTKAETLPQVTPPEYPKNGWFFMGFKTLMGGSAGVSIFQHPDFTTSSTRWYYLTDSEIPFFFFSPAAVYDSKIELKKDESLVLKYRVWILPEADEKMMEEKYHQYIYE